MPPVTKEERRGVCRIMRDFRRIHVLSVPQMSRLMGVTDRQIQYWEREKFLPRRAYIERFRRLQEAFEGDGAKPKMHELLGMTKKERRWQLRRQREAERRVRINQKVAALSLTA